MPEEIKMPRPAFMLIILAALVAFSPASANSQVKTKVHNCDSNDPQEKALLDAVKWRDPERVKQLLRQGVNPNAKDDCGEAAIHFAAGNGSPEIAKELIASRADVNSMSGGPFPETPLILALDWSEVSGADNTYEVVKLLVEAGADVNLKGDSHDPPPLARAVSKGLEKVAALLIAAGADINAKVYEAKEPYLAHVTAYTYAAALGNQKLKDMLLAAGANPRVGVAEYKRDFGDDALIQAASADRTDVVEALLAEGVDVNTANQSGVTALMRVVDDSTLDALLNAGADVNRKDGAGFTALMWAAVTGRTEHVKKLIAAGADVNARNNERETALDLARPDAKEVLLHAGAKPGRSVLSRLTLQ